MDWHCSSDFLWIDKAGRILIEGPFVNPNWRSMSFHPLPDNEIDIFKGGGGFDFAP